MTGAQFLFWFATVALGYTFIGYPVLICIWARLNRRYHFRAPMNPSLSILVVVHNEAHRISRRIENLLALDYDRDKLEIVIASDGSSDGTAALAAPYREAGVHVVAFDRNRGKPAVLNDLIPRLRGDVVVLMDTRQHIDEDALHWLVDDFADPEVGAVSGELFLTREENDHVLEGVGFYWRYEKFVRQQESRVDSAVGVTGALYALRRDLFEPIPEETILDDVLIPLQISRKGYRVLFEPGARAVESLSASAEAEFRRKVRTIAGNFQLFCQHAWLLNPFANRLWFQTVCHKFFRLLCPVFLAVVFVTNLLLLDSHFYQGLLVLQMLFYLAALAGHLSPGLAMKMSLFSIPHAFCLLAWSTVVGSYRYFSGQQSVTWVQVKNPDQR